MEEQLTTTLDIEVLPKQMEFIADDTHREVGYSGAFGAGKSRALCLKLVRRASQPGAVEGLCRKTFEALRMTTLRTLLEPDGLLPAVLPEGAYEHNKNEKTIRIHGGGMIQYFGLDKETKIGSLNLSGCAIDEAVELAEEDYRQLRGRIRMQCGLVNQLYWACNPGPPSHFLAARFGLALDAKPADNCRAISTSTLENTFLPKEYIDDLNTFSGLAHKRYVLGQWAGSDGLVYDRWDRGVHVQSVDIIAHDRIVVGVDYGYTNPFAALRVGVDGDGRAHVLAEEYGTGVQQEPMVEAIRRLSHGAEAVVVDAASPALIDALRAVGLHAIPCEKGPNSVFNQITQVVQPRLLKAGDGKPRLTVDPSCVNLIRELETYEWRDGKDEPVKAHDHAPDALRYALTYVDGTGAAPVIAVACAGGDEYDAEEAMWN